MVYLTPGLVGGKNFITGGEYLVYSQSPNTTSANKSAFVDISDTCAIKMLPEWSTYHYYLYHLEGYILGGRPSQGLDFSH